MKFAVGYIALFLALATTVSAFGDDQKKAEKQASRITAMASDPTGRRIVSMTMADVLRVPRLQLVRERLAMNLNYGSLFIAHQLTASGVKMLDIALQLQAGKNIVQIGDERSANWKQIVAAAKKLNHKIDDNLYTHFVNGVPDNERDQLDRYNVVRDGVKADNDVSDDDLAEARARYLLWRNQAGIGMGSTGSLSIADEKAAYVDHAKSAGPQAQGTEGGAPPAAGGISPR